jgi:dTMP kinase
VPGLFVVLEGGDGAGKSTQLRRLAAWLMLAGREVVVTYEPGDTPLGATIRRLLLDHSSGDVSPRAEAMLYAADKAQHVSEVVGGAGGGGREVIAYQAAGRSLDPGEIRGLADWATGGLSPDLTVVLDVPVERALGEKTDLDRIESAGAEFHARVRTHFLDLAAQDPSRYLVLPGRDDRDAIEAAIRARVEPLLP